MKEWLKAQLTEAHKMLDVMGVPDRVRRPDPRPPYGEQDVSLSVPERLAWLRANWQKANWPPVDKDQS